MGDENNADFFLSIGLLIQRLQPNTFYSKGYINKKGWPMPTYVPRMKLFLNQAFLDDLEKIWELRYWIPDPNKLEYANCECAPNSRYRG